MPHRRAVEFQERRLCEQLLAQHSSSVTQPSAPPPVTDPKEHAKQVFGSVYAEVVGGSTNISSSALLARSA
jgi:hypothetical protein